MTIVFEMNGRKRKELVNAISEITGAKAAYKFMPTCAYEIGSYTVNKYGSLDTGSYDKAEVRELIAALACKGFVCNEEDVEIAEETLTPPDTAAITETEEVSEESEKAADKATQVNTEPTTENNGIDRFSISMQRDFFDEALFAKLDRLIESKRDYNDLLWPS